VIAETAARVRERLAGEGFAIMPGVLGAGALERLRAVAERRVATASAEHLAKNRTTGSMLPIADDPAFGFLIGYPAVVGLLRALGLGAVVWQAGYVISKPPAAPRLFWHQDWLYWTHPVSLDPTPHQLFAMYYLVDTDRANGCLRVIPGSHRGLTEAHRKLARAHSPEALSGADPDHPMFGDMPGEIDVPVRAGDLLLGDSRLLHAAHANASGVARTLLTLWYHPAWDQLPEGIRAHVAASYGGALEHWTPAERAAAGCALPRVDTDAPPWPIRREPQFTGYA
jgi:hypothetical protein